MLNEPCKGYGVEIQEIRERIGITRSELAIITETDEKLIEELELSKIHPSDYLIEKLADAFQMNPFEIKKYIWCEESSFECLKKKES